MIPDQLEQAIEQALEQAKQSAIDEIMNTEPFFTLVSEEANKELNSLDFYLDIEEDGDDLLLFISGSSESGIYRKIPLNNDTTNRLLTRMLNHDPKQLRRVATKLEQVANSARKALAADANFPAP